MNEVGLGVSPSVFSYKEEPYWNFFPNLEQILKGILM